MILIFFKLIQNVSKTYWDKSCIYQDRNNQQMKCFLQISPFGIQHIYSSKKLSFWRGVNIISFHVLLILEFLTFEMNFDFWKQEKAASSWKYRVLHLYNPVFHTQILYKNRFALGFFFSINPNSSSSCQWGLEYTDCIYWRGVRAPIQNG